MTAPTSLLMLLACRQARQAEDAGDTAKAHKLLQSHGRMIFIVMECAGTVRHLQPTCMQHASMEGDALLQINRIHHIRMKWHDDHMISFHDESSSHAMSSAIMFLDLYFTSASLMLY